MRRTLVLGLLFALGACVAPVPPSPATSVTGQTYPVFFTEWSAKLDDPAQTAVTAAAARAKQYPTHRVLVTGYADPTGSKQANLLLSQLRAQMVSDQLVTDGIDAGRIQLGGRGATEYQLTSQESRRVEINVAP